MPIKRLKAGSLPAFKFLSTLTLILTLSACATYQGPSAPIILVPTPPDEGHPTYPKPDTYPNKPRPAEQASPTAIEPIATRPQTAPDAVASLLDKARDANHDHRHDTAIAFAERAQRIDSRHPEVYLVLGNAYFAKEQYALAQQMALKGIAFSSNGTSVRRALEILRDRASAPQM